jgi:hypothetical protein
MVTKFTASGDQMPAHFNDRPCPRLSGTPGGQNKRPRAAIPRLALPQEQRSDCVNQALGRKWRILYSETIGA